MNETRLAETLIHVPHMSELNALRSSQHGDVFEELHVFHEALRDVVAWLPTIVDAEGSASPRDARWLRAFLRGPMRWHLYDEETAFLPRLACAAEDRSPNTWLERCVKLARTHHEGMRAATEALLGIVDDLARGERVDLNRWRAHTDAVARTFDGALAFEDDILVPTARLLFDSAERATLREEMRALDAGRPWDGVEAAGDVPTLHRIHTVSTRRRDREGEATHPFADCPRGRTVSAESVCRRCPELHHFGVDANGRAIVACAIDDARRNGDALRVRDVMTRDVRCVSAETAMRDALELFAGQHVTGAPVVDAVGRPIGVVSQTDVVRALRDGYDVRELEVRDVMMHIAFVVAEDATLADAIHLFRAETVHRLPVVNADGVVVGVLSPLDILRAGARSSDGERRA